MKLFNITNVFLLHPRYKRGRAGLKQKQNRMINIYFMLLVVLINNCNIVDNDKIVVSETFEGWGAIIYYCNNEAMSNDVIISNNQLFFFDGCMDEKVFEYKFYSGSVSDENIINDLSDSTEYNKDIKYILSSIISQPNLYYENNAYKKKVEILYFYIGKKKDIVIIDSTFRKFEEKVLSEVRNSNR